MNKEEVKCILDLHDCLYDLINAAKEKHCQKIGYEIDNAEQCLIEHYTLIKEIEQEAFDQKSFHYNIYEEQKK